jgi:hypothetical protein
LISLQFRWKVLKHSNNLSLPTWNHNNCRKRWYTVAVSSIPLAGASISCASIKLIGARHSCLSRSGTSNFHHCGRRGYWDANYKASQPNLSVNTINKLWIRSEFCQFVGAIEPWYRALGSHKNQTDVQRDSKRRGVFLSFSSPSLTCAVRAGPRQRTVFHSLPI